MSTESGEGQIDRARWYNPIVDGEPSLGWDAFLNTFALCLEVAQRHPWLAEWKYAAPERSLRIEAWADQAHGERFLDKFVTPAWTDAGCAGTPQIQVALVEGTKWRGMLYLSASDERALIVRSKASEGDLWLDALEISFHPKTPTYAVVNRDGTYDVRTIGQ